ncbi:MAG: D-alanyl-D-alanine carboxypeptidase [Clostridiales bacterium]|nr:D-alanyl-D-alanine carboxypeptidase [Clostridiales bacterium]
MKKILLFLILLIPMKVLGINTSARSAILMDIDSNRILYEENINEKRSVASISKIMTAVIAIESGKLNDKVVIGEEINSSYGSGIYIKIGEEMTLKDLVYGLMLRSGNDAALAIAKFVGGSVEEFVEMMNKKAKDIGMKNTTFNNPNGLDQEQGNYSTAYDMAILTSYAMKLDDYKKITGTKKHTLTTNKNVYSWINKNKLLFIYKYTTGGKTGFTEIAKRTLVSTATKDNINLVVVTLNDGNDWQDHQSLFEYGFNNYSNLKILEKGYITIYDDKYYQDYKLYIKNDYYYLLSNAEENNLIFKYELEKKRKLKTKDKVGVLNIFLGDKKIHEENIYIELTNNTKRSFFDKIKEWFVNIW